MHRGSELGISIFLLSLQDPALREATQLADQDFLRFLVQSFSSTHSDRGKGTFTASGIQIQKLKSTTRDSEFLCSDTFCSVARLLRISSS